jgi:DNA-binding PadR family transcriptional regulator
VEEQSGGRLDPSTGTLYQALHRLKEEGLIASVEPSNTRMNDGSISS